MTIKEVINKLSEVPEEKRDLPLNVWAYGIDAESHFDIIDISVFNEYEKLSEDNPLSIDIRIYDWKQDRIKNKKRGEWEHGKEKHYRSKNGRNYQ